MLLFHLLPKMAQFWMWIASFFTLAIFLFWRCKGLAWFSWEDKDFSQVQSGHYKRLCNVIPSLEKCLKDMEATSKTKILNKNQCVHLFGKLVLGMKEINKMLSIANVDLNFQFVCEELFVLQKKVEIVRKNCNEEEQWCHAAVFQLQNKETFRELLFDLKCWYNSARDIFLNYYPNESNNVLPIQFDVATYEQVLEDGQELQRKLECALQGEVLADYEIALHLLLRLKNLDRVDGGDLDALELPNDFKTPKLFQKIGKGGYGDVYRSNWLGLSCATKVLKGDLEYLMNCRKEVGILAGLSHPNLVQFFGCGISTNVGEKGREEEIGVVQLKKSSFFQILKSLIPFFGCGIIKKVDENPKEDEMHMVMELMDSNLSTMLKKAKRPLPYSIALDIMHQIAKGVCYLHDMQVAHLDLKPDNVLCSSILIEGLNPCRIFKVMDYGTSQLEVCSHPKHPEPSKYTIGTLGYMAPEMTEESTTPQYPFQADVWSFAMICSEILSGKVPYSGLDLKDIYDQLKGAHGSSLRPTLPTDFEGLTTLIQECWSQDPLQRPTFSNICKRLTNLKKSFLKGGSSAFKDFESIVNHIPRVDEAIAPPKDILVDLDRQLSKAKGLLERKYIGIVGMGGIGKTTLAKAIFDDTTVNSLYHASCFIADCKNYPNSYEILCKILPKLGNDCKPMNLRDAQEMLKEVLLGKKVLLILDDVNEEALMHDIVPSNIIQASKGTTIIITTRQWNTIKSFVDIKGRLDIAFLDEKAATTLFTSHLCWSEASLSPNFVALRKHIVNACNGLPLSLKVMGAFLHHKERLRSWEQALQRMARGRNLDGDGEIWNTLQISFDGLKDGVEKGMFLDVACFFCRDVYPLGISKATILLMWSKDGILPVGKLKRLIDMSLLKVNGDGDSLEMHDQLRDMGRRIAKDTRIWKASLIPANGFSSKDVEVLEGIYLQGPTNHHLPLLNKDPSFAFEKLRVLILQSAFDSCEAYVDNLTFLLEIASRCPQLEAILIGDIRIWTRLSYRLSADTTNTLSTRISDLCATHASLKILDLKGLHFLKQFPNIFASSNTLLRLCLDSCSSLVALPKGVGNLSSLTTLNLRGCLGLATLPKEVGNLSSLTTLRLKGCSNLSALPNEVETLSSLTILNLDGCSSLLTLPKEVGNLSSLTWLNLHGCSSLSTLPEELENLSSLTTLDLEGCSSLLALPKEVGNLSALNKLDLGGCSSLSALSKEVGNLSSLTWLSLHECSSLSALPKEVGNLSSLTWLNLHGCSSLLALPKEVGNLSSLNKLDLAGCSNLSALPKEVGNLSSLTWLDLGGCSSLLVLPKEVGNLSSLTKLDLWGCPSLLDLPKEVGNLSSLNKLDLAGCSNLSALPKEVWNLSFLTWLNLHGCSSLSTLLEELENLSSLNKLDLGGCPSLSALPKEVGNLSSLTWLSLHGCSSLSALPKEVGNLSSLTTLYLGGCSSLSALPKEVGNLSALTTLYLHGCSTLLDLPKEVGNLSSLTTLSLGGCSTLSALPKEVGNLSSLTWLSLHGYASLSALPKEVGNLSSLTTLYLGGCSSLSALPKEVGNLSSLTWLNLHGCSSLSALPKEVGNLSALNKLDLGGCSSLLDLPKEVGNLSSLTWLSLHGCSSLSALPKEVGNLSALNKLDLGGCSSLLDLPKEVGNLSSLTWLNLHGYSSLSALPKEVGNLSSLTWLNLHGCSSLLALPKEVGNLSSLTTIRLKGCSNLSALPNEVETLSSLTILNLDGCSSLLTLPKEVGNLSSLTWLNLHGCSSLLVLPKEVGNLSSLTTLYLDGCSSLLDLPKEVGNLSSLNKLDLKGCSSLSALPKEVGNLSSLTILRLKGCSSLSTLPEELENLSSLTTLDLEGCSSLSALPKE